MTFTCDLKSRKNIKTLLSTSCLIAQLVFLPATSVYAHEGHGMDATGSGNTMSDIKSTSNTAAAATPTSGTTNPSIPVPSSVPNSGSTSVTQGTNNISTNTSVQTDTQPLISSSPCTGKTHTVKSGDICITISAMHGISLSDLYSMNPTVNSECTNLMLDQVLCVSSGGSSQSANAVDSASLVSSGGTGSTGAGGDMDCDDQPVSSVNTPNSLVSGAGTGSGTGTGTGTGTGNGAGNGAGSGAGADDDLDCEKNLAGSTTSGPAGAGSTGSTGTASYGAGAKNRQIQDTTIKADSNLKNSADIVAPTDECENPKRR